MARNRSEKECTALVRAEHGKKLVRGKPVMDEERKKRERAMMAVALGVAYFFTRR